MQRLFELRGESSGKNYTENMENSQEGEKENLGRDEAPKQCKKRVSVRDDATDHDWLYEEVVIDDDDDDNNNYDMKPSAVTSIYTRPTTTYAPMWSLLKQREIWCEHCVLQLTPYNIRIPLIHSRALSRLFPKVKWHRDFSKSIIQQFWSDDEQRGAHRTMLTRFFTHETTARASHLVGQWWRYLRQNISDFRVNRAVVEWYPTELVNKNRYADDECTQWSQFPQCAKPNEYVIVIQYGDRTRPVCAYLPPPNDAEMHSAHVNYTGAEVGKMTFVSSQNESRMADIQIIKLRDLNGCMIGCCRFHENERYDENFRRIRYGDTFVMYFFGCVPKI